MPWIYRRKGTSAWWIGWRVNGRQFLRSTNKTNRQEAEKVLAEYRAMEEARKASKLSEDFFLSLTGNGVQGVPLTAALRDWIAEAEASSSPKTSAKYLALSKVFSDYLKASETAPLLRDITSADVRRYLTERRQTVSAATVNLERKILSSFFNRAMVNEQIRSNPVKAVKRFRGGPEDAKGRRPFTLEELKLMYSKAPNDFWRFMILAGFYLGQRLGDLVCLVWGGVDFEENIIRITPRKTAHSTAVTLQIPMARPLRDLLAELRDKAGEVQPAAFIWPAEAEEYLAHGASSFSAEFYNLILAPCGFVVPREDKAAHKRGRKAKRESSPLTFHSIRHSFVTLLKATGGNQAVAKELAGRSSDVVSDLYTKMPPQI